MNTPKRKIDAWRSLHLTTGERAVVSAFAQWNTDHPDSATGACRAQVCAKILLTDQTVRTAIQRLQRRGVLYATGHRRTGQPCYRYEPLAAAWSERSRHYQNVKRYRRTLGFLNEYQHELSEELRGLLRDFAGPTHIQTPNP